jgi:NTE family protein
VEGGIPLGLHSKLYAGAAYVNSADEYYQTERFKKEDEPDKTKFNAFASQLGIENNSLNYKQFATEGVFNCLSVKYITGKETNEPGTTSNTSVKSSKNHQYFLAEASSLKYWNFGSRFTLGTQVEAVFSNKEMFQNYRSTLLTAPGYYPTPHSKTLFLENFHSNNYLAGGLKFLIHFSPSMHLRLEGHGFVPLKEEMKSEELLVYRNPDIFSNYYLQGMAAMVYHTGLGPISLSVNYYEKTNTNLFLNLSFGYTIFNNRGF